jgi:plastocyanin
MTESGRDIGSLKHPRSAEEPASLGSFARRHPLLLGAIACLLASTGGIAAAAVTDGGISVSQKGREFTPGTLSIKRGQTVQIVNDDMDLLHHAYIDAETFKFDSGDQLPGSKTGIVFSVAGDFKVLCGIHPKMKLLVHVE